MQRLFVLSLLLFASSPCSAAAGDVTLTAIPAALTPGMAFAVEVRIDSGAQLLGSYQFEVFWDPAKVTYVGIGCGASAMGCPIAINPMAASVVFNDIDTIGVGPGAALHVATINFMAAIGCAGDPGIIGSVLIVSEPSGVLIGGLGPRPMIPPVLSCPGITPTGLCGDCDNNGDTNILDALVAARAATGLAVIDPLLAGQCDVSPIRGDITTLDALLIAQFVVGLVVISCV